MKSDDPNHIGKHKFEVAGLGLAPFRYTGMTENAVKCGDTVKAGGCCDYCSAGIRFEFWLKSADGRQFKVGSDCINKSGDAGLIQAYKTSADYRKHQRDLRDQARRRTHAALAECLPMLEAEMRTLPHPQGFSDRQTGQPLTYWDHVQWMWNNCGAAGELRLLKSIRARFAHRFQLVEAA